MNSQHNRQQSTDGKMKIYRKPAPMASTSINFSASSAVVAASVSLDKPRKRNDRNANVYAFFPSSSNTMNKNLLLPTGSATASSSVETSSSESNYKKSSLSSPQQHTLCSSTSTTPSTSPHARRRSRKDVATATKPSNNDILESLSIDALYDKIRGNVADAASSKSSSFTPTESSSRTVEAQRSRAQKKQPTMRGSSAATTATIRPTDDNGDVDEIYFDISALNFDFKQRTTAPLCQLQQLQTQPCANNAAAGAARGQLPNIFFSFDDNADIYSLHSLPLRSPGAVDAARQQQQSSLRQRRQLPQVPTAFDDERFVLCKNGSPRQSQRLTGSAADKPTITYRKPHRPVTATSSSASTQPLLSPTAASVFHAETVEGGGASITCARCHKCRCCACREPLGRIEHAGRFARKCLEYGSCMWCARQCVSDEEDCDDAGKKNVKRRSASASRRRRSSSTGFFSGRRLKLAVLSLVCPCLCLYKPLKIGGTACGKMCKRVVAHRACLCEPDANAGLKQAEYADDEKRAETFASCGGDEKLSVLFFNSSGDNNKTLEHTKNQDLLLALPPTKACLSAFASLSCSPDAPYDFLSSFLSTNTASSASTAAVAAVQPVSSSSSSSTDTIFG